MNLARRMPILGMAAGLVLLVVGFNYNHKALLIVGLVLLALGAIRQFRRR